MKRFTFVLAWILPTALYAQSLEQALGQFKNEDYESAAFSFYDLLVNDARSEVRDQAQAYLGESLKKMKLYVPALFYYRDLLAAGKGNRFYLSAVQGLLELQELLHDPFVIPTLMNTYLDADGFGQLAQEKVSRINYLIGELLFRQRKNKEARAFLEHVDKLDKNLYVRAHYLLGLLDVRAENFVAALEKFTHVAESLQDEHSNHDLKDLRELARLAMGRTSYGLGKFNEAEAAYLQVTRFSEQWFNALYEDAWVHYRLGNYGKALGDIEAVLTPSFNKRLTAEAYVVAGTTYFSLCQWDRTRQRVQVFKLNYETKIAELKKYMENELRPDQIYRDVAQGGDGKFATEFAREVRRNKRFLDYHYMLTHLRWEKQKIAEVQTWKSSRLLGDLSAILADQEQALETMVGAWVKVQLAALLSNLENLQTQINILDFELVDAERQWLEQGREILKGRRAQLPRPQIPNDQWQHWSFSKEYWRDELGYYQHTLRSECF